MYKCTRGHAGLMKEAQGKKSSRVDSISPCVSGLKQGGYLSCQNNLWPLVPAESDLSGWLCSSCAVMFPHTQVPVDNAYWSVGGGGHILYHAGMVKESLSIETTNVRRMFDQEYRIPFSPLLLNKYPIQLPDGLRVTPEYIHPVMFEFKLRYVVYTNVRIQWSIPNSHSE